jgi:hypothetical protein
MQRPPSGKGLPLAPVSPIHDWINRISGKQTELTKLGLSPEQQTNLRAFVERAFTASALGLTGLDIREEKIALLQRSQAIEQWAPDGADSRILTALASIRVLQSIPDPGGASLTPDLLLLIHDPSGGEASARDEHHTSDASSHETPRVTPRIRAFCDWSSADSFRELNALEQAAITILRLLEIRPFEQGNVAAALGASSLFTMRAGWPPIIIPAALRPRFNPAIAEGMKMNTRPLVDLLAESLYETLDSMIDFARAQTIRQ